MSKYESSPEIGRYEAKEKAKREVDSKVERPVIRRCWERFGFTHSCVVPTQRHRCTRYGKEIEGRRERDER